MRATPRQAYLGANPSGQRPFSRLAALQPRAKALRALAPRLRLAKREKCQLRRIFGFIRQSLSHNKSNRWNGDRMEVTRPCEKATTIPSHTRQRSTNTGELQAH